jgi:hypothetical protein
MWPHCSSQTIAELNIQFGVLPVPPTLRFLQHYGTSKIGLKFHDQTENSNTRYDIKQQTERVFSQ